MNTQGSSLFFGGQDIYIDDAAQRLQEQEEQEDQIRRELELQKELEEKFKYLDDEDDDNDEIDDDDDDDYNHSINNSSRFAESIQRKMRTNTHESNDKVPHGNLRDELSEEINRKNANDERFANYTPYNDNPHIVENKQYDGRYNSPIEGYGEYIQKKISSEFVSNDQQLKLLYDVRVHEVQRLSEELEKCRRDASNAHDALYARLAIANSEKERAQISLQQSQELVANSKHHITELERKVASLSCKVETLQNHNDELTAEVSAATASLIDTQTRLQAEKLNNGNAKTDAMFRGQQVRYKEDMERLEQDLLKTRNRLSDKENELLAFEKRYFDMERLKDNLLLEKGSVINKLAIKLEETQSRISNNGNRELEEKISRLAIEKNTAQFQVKELANKLELTANELVETRSKLSNAQKEMTILESTINDMLGERQSDSFSILRNSKSGQEFSSHSDNINLLRNEFAKSTKILQLRKEEINKLKDSLKNQEAQMEYLRENEKKLNDELKLYKEKEMSQISEMKQLSKSDFDSNLVESLRARCEYLEKQINIKTDELNSFRFKSQIEVKSTENISSNNDGKLCNVTKDVENISSHPDEYKNLYLEVCIVRDKLQKELEELQSTDLYKSLEEERTNVKELLNQLKNEKLKVDDIGNQLLNIKLETFQKGLDNLKKSTSESNENSLEFEELKKMNELLVEENIQFKITDEERKKNVSVLINELEEYRKLVEQLNTEIELQGQREELISHMKEKEKQFGELINEKNKVIDMKDSSTSPLPFVSQENLVASNINLEMERLSMEKKIRQENAHLFSVELKAVENTYNEKLSELDKEFNAKLIQLGGILKIKTEEVETMKEIFLSERTKFQEALAILKDQITDESHHDDCKKEILNYQKIVKELSFEIEKLKNDSKANPELQEVQSKFMKTFQAMETLKNKYKTVKTTHRKYKEYAAEKDEHYKNEVRRIENAYKEKFNRLNDRLDLYIKQKEQESKSKSSKH